MGAHNAPSMIILHFRDFVKGFGVIFRDAKVTFFYQKRYRRKIRPNIPAPPAADRTVGSLHSGLRPSFREPTLFYLRFVTFLKTIATCYCNLRK